MTTLRVLLAAPPVADRADPFALFDDAGRRIARDVAAPAQWPRADRLEAVVAAGATRLIVLRLPPMPTSRLPAAAVFALEDQLAGPSDAQAIVLGEPNRDGTLVARIVSRELVDALRAHAPPFARAVAEPDLAPPGSGWRWCAAMTGSFVRRSDGSAFPVGHALEGALPPELELALGEAARRGDAPRSIVVEGAVTDALLESLQRRGVRVERGDRWEWDAAPAAAFTAAPDVLAAPRSPAGDAERPASRARLFAPALRIAAAALLLQIAASLADVAVQRIDLSRTAQRFTALASEAGLGDLAPDAARDALARDYRAKRHAVGLTAPDDAMPLLARAAPALAALPAGSLRSASYAGRAWTLELARLDDASVATFEQRLAAEGLTALRAASPAGFRLRLSVTP